MPGVKMLGGLVALFVGVVALIWGLIDLIGGGDMFRGVVLVIAGGVSAWFGAKLSGILSR